MNHCSSLPCLKAAAVKRTRPPAAPGAGTLRKSCDGQNCVNSLKLGSPGHSDTSCSYQQISGCSLFVHLLLTFGSCFKHHGDIASLLQRQFFLFVCFVCLFVSSLDFLLKLQILWPGSAPLPLSRKGFWPCFGKKNFIYKGVPLKVVL